MFKNPYVLLFVFLAVLGAFGGISAWMYSKGLDEGIAECNSEKQEAINENISIKEKQDAIIRADDAAYIDSLQRGTF